jgi:NAD(P)-dependent dehydrogenase (short-subunit alcohol dehydrogenase family)
MTMLDGKVAWVTGGGRGIGAAIAAELRRQGAQVFVTDRDSQGGVEACDVRDPSALHAYAESVGARAGRLDILVNNAGVQRRRDLVDFTDADYDAIFETNVRGCFFAAQAAAKAMIACGARGAIVNVSSVNATHAQPETALYCASKGAVRTMTRALAVGLGGYGIRVNDVAPGTIATDLNRDRLADDATVAAVIANTPMARLGTPLDVAPAVAFLVSDAAQFITGASLAIHGGWTLTG